MLLILIVSLSKHLILFNLTTWGKKVTTLPIPQFDQITLNYFQQAINNIISYGQKF